MNRREFFKAVAAFGAGAALLPLIPAAPPEIVAKTVAPIWHGSWVHHAVAARLGEQAGLSMDKMIMAGFTDE